MFWSSFFLGIYCAFGIMAVWKLYSWHLEACHHELGHDDFIEAEFYILD